MLLSRLRGCIPCKRMRCRVGLMPDMPVSLTRCGRFSARQAPVPRGPVVYSAWRRLGSSVDAPPEGRALPLPVLRVVVAVVSMSRPGCPPKLEVCCLQLCLCDQETIKWQDGETRTTPQKRTCNKLRRRPQQKPRDNRLTNIQKKTSSDQLNLSTGPQPCWPSEVASTSCDDDVATRPRLWFHARVHTDNKAMPPRCRECAVDAFLQTPTSLGVARVWWLHVRLGQNVSVPVCSFGV